MIPFIWSSKTDQTDLWWLKSENGCFRGGDYLKNWKGAQRNFCGAMGHVLYLVWVVVTWVYTIDKSHQIEVRLKIFIMCKFNFKKLLYKGLLLNTVCYSWFNHSSNVGH